MTWHKWLAIWTQWLSGWCDGVRNKRYWVQVPRSTSTQGCKYIQLMSLKKGRNERPGCHHWSYSTYSISNDVMIFVFNKFTVKKSFRILFRDYTKIFYIFINCYFFENFTADNQEDNITINVSNSCVVRDFIYLFK